MTKRELRIIGLSVLVMPIVYALLAALAYQQRGYFAFGGECVAILIPIFTYLFLLVRDC